MTKIGRLLKLGLPASVGATGIVCLTMHLTNQTNTDFYSLYSLNLDKRPDLNEEELKPTIPPAPSAPAKPANPSPEVKPTTESTDAAPAKESSGKSPSSAEGELASDQDIKEIIRQIMQEMRDKQHQ